MRSKRILWALLFTLPLLGFAPLASADTSHKGMCLFSRDVSSVKVLDRDHIVFFMKDGAAWENTLWKKCYRLRRDAYLDWGQDEFDIAVCTWPMAGPPYPVVDGRNPADTRPRFSVALRENLGHCVLGTFAPYTAAVGAEPASVGSSHP